VVIAAQFKRLFLRCIERDARRNGLKLADAIWLLAEAKFTETKSGKVLTSTSGNGHSVTFTIPSSGQGYPPHVMTEFFGWLIDLHEEIRAGLTDPTDNDVVEAMLAEDRMRACKGARSDFSYLVH